MIFLLHLETSFSVMGIPENSRLLKKVTIDTSKALPSNDNSTMASSAIEIRSASSTMEIPSKSLSLGTMWTVNLLMILC